MSHEVPRGGPLKVREGELLEMAQKIVSQIVFDVPGNNNDGLPREECEEPCDERETDDERGVAKEIGAAERMRLQTLLEGVNRSPDEEGLGNREEVAQDDGEETQQKDLPVSSKVWKETKKRFQPLSL